MEIYFPPISTIIYISIILVVIWYIVINIICCKHGNRIQHITVSKENNNEPKLSDALYNVSIPTFVTFITLNVLITDFAFDTASELSNNINNSYGEICNIDIEFIIFLTISGGVLIIFSVIIMRSKITNFFEPKQKIPRSIAYIYFIVLLLLGIYISSAQVGKQFEKEQEITKIYNNVEEVRSSIIKISSNIKKYIEQ